MTRILHVSDLHFGPPFLPTVAESLLRSAQELEPDVIVASGDFTQNATVEEFTQAQQYLSRLPDVPLAVTPGNHDVPQLPRWGYLRSPFFLYQQFIRPELDFHLLHQDLAIVSLNSTGWFGSWFQGRINRKQLAYCKEVFAKVPDENLRIVVAHHHLAPAPSLKRTSVMQRAGRTIEHLTDMNVDLVLGGHVHRAYVGNSLDFYPGKARENGIIIVQCGTSTSSRGRGGEREKCTFNLIEVEQSVVQIKHYVYFTPTDRFEILSEHLFARRATRFVSPDVQIQSMPTRVKAQV